MKMAFGGVSFVFYVIAIIFVVFLSDINRVKAGKILLANTGENITLPCSVGRSVGNIYWFREAGEFIAAVDSGFPSGGLNDNHTYSDSFSQVFEKGSNNRSFTLRVHDIDVSSSGNYTCYLYFQQNYSTLARYDVRVVGCPNCITYRSALDAEAMVVKCSLTNFHGSKRERRLNISRDGVNESADIVKNIITFTTSISDKGIIIEFNPYIDIQNIGSNIICNVSPRLWPKDPTHSSISTPMIITSTQSDSSSSSSSSDTSSSTDESSFQSGSENPIAPLPTTSLNVRTTATSNKPSTTEYDTSITTKSSQAPSTSFTLNSSSINFKSALGTTKTRATSSKRPQGNLDIETGEEFNRDNTVIIISVTGSVVIIFLIVVTVAVRFRQAQDQHENKTSPMTANDCTDGRPPPDEHEYEMITEIPPTRPCELVNNILYESSDEIIRKSTSKSCEQLDNVLYTVPDKMGVVNHVAKSVVSHDSCNSYNDLRDNEKNTSHGEVTKQRQEPQTQYEDVDMSGIGAGNGEGGDIPLYAVLDNGTNVHK